MSSPSLRVRWATISFAGLHPATTAWLTGQSVTVEVFAAAQVFNANSTPFLHDGGQQVLHDRREPIVDVNGNVATYQASSVTDILAAWAEPELLSRWI